ncbi:MAG: metallophosphoesterase [Nitriliruptorales bacterium]
MSLARVLGAAGLLAGGAFAYASLVERNWFRVRHEDLPGTLRAGRRPLRVLLLADMHHSPPQHRLSRFLRSLADLDYDLVVAAGDMLGAHDAEEPTVDLLAMLTDEGVPGLAVIGSNDLFAPTLKSPDIYFHRHPGLRAHGAPLDTDRYREGLVAAGWRVLEDERTTLETRAGLVEVAGLRDPHFPAVRLPPLEAVRPAAESAVLRLGLVHAPYTHALDLLASAGYDVLLAGHTHGGQVRVPGVGALVTNCDLETGRARGTSRWAGSVLHVTPGVGQSRFAPFRFACRPEVSLLTLLP